MPVILPPNRWLWDGFCRLSEKRGRIEGTPQPIPVSEMLAYAVSRGIMEEPQRDFFYRVVDELDAIYMKHHWDQVTKAAAARRRGQK